MVKDNDSKIVVKYDNGLNKIALSGFKPIEKDLFATLCAAIKEKGTEKITFDFDKLRDLSSYKPTSLERFTKDLASTNKKLMSLNFNIEDEHRIVQFVLFPTFIIDKDKKTLEIAVHEQFRFLLNDVTTTFTRFELKEFVSLSSTYAKDIYKLLKQFRLTGYCKIFITDFRNLLDIPKSYEICDIDRKVLSPTIIKELKPYFAGLTVEKKYLKKRGKPVEAFIFRFQAENDIRDGKGTFMDDDGLYYEKNLLDFSPQDVKIKFPEYQEKQEQTEEAPIIIPAHTESIKADCKNEQPELSEPTQQEPTAPKEKRGGFFGWFNKK